MKVVKKTIRNIRNFKSTSHNDISTIAINKLCNEIAPWMNRLIILSFEENRFPDPQDPNLLSWKCACIVPIYKGKGDKTEMSSYRPVALLPILSKVLESIMVQQMYEQFERNIPVGRNLFKRLLTDRQYGYRSRMSCSSNIVQLLDDVLQDCQNGDEAAFCMADLSVPFDTVPHSILLDKLRLCGLSPETIM